MQNSIKSLKSQIKEIPKDVLNMFPDNEINIFKNYKFFPVELLVSADWNYKMDDDFMSQQLLNNIKRNGQIVTCQLRKLDTGYYEVVDGNHRLKAFKELGQKFVIAYDHGTITQAHAERLAIETNETKFSADATKLASILAELKIEFPEDELLTTLPFEPSEFNDLLNNEIKELIDTNSIDSIKEDEFDHPEPIKPKTLKGDYYEMNNHRLLCGDSTSNEHVSQLLANNIAHLLFTDPPYNISYAKYNKNRHKNGKDWTEEYCSEWEDSMSDKEYEKFLFDFLKNAKDNLIENAHYYVWHSTNYYEMLKKAFADNDIPIDKVPIQWVKQVAPFSHVNYWRITEPCIFGGKNAVTRSSANARWFGKIGEVNAWLIDREHNGFYIHPTQKPIKLAARAINNSSQIGEIVLDLFGGSGSTLIASDILKRTCYLMEYEPKFCDLIVLRFMKYCEDNNLNCTITRNGETIDKSFFQYPESEIKTRDKQ